jgi:SAM-dependent methyltransferase
MLLDQLAGEPATGVLERDDGYTEASLPASTFFTSYDEWPAEEQEAMRFVSGRVLDVGCGAGRHLLYLEHRRHDVLGIDVSPGALEVCRRRGATSVELLSVTQVSPRLGTFDTVLMLCGNFGLFGTERRARRLLRRLVDMTTSQARLVIDTNDPTRTTNPDHLAYQQRNRERGLASGYIRVRLRYKDAATPWFELLNVSPDELATLLDGTGWYPSAILEPTDGSNYTAVLAKSR